MFLRENSWPLTRGCKRFLERWRTVPQIAASTLVTWCFWKHCQGAGWAPAEWDAHWYQGVYQIVSGFGVKTLVCLLKSENGLRRAEVKRTISTAFRPTLVVAMVTLFTAECFEARDVQNGNCDKDYCLVDVLETRVLLRG